MITKKKCIIFSQGPAPTPEHDKVEGGGLRCWGLAKGLISNKDNQIDVTFAYSDSYQKEPFTEEYEGIHVTTWNSSTIMELVEDCDVVIVSYCMGGLSKAVVDSLRVDQQLVLDCYVPIYVEASARESSDIESEYHAFMGEVPIWASVLLRGDTFLCSSEAQKRYYLGVLSAVGRINPVTYNEELITIVPYGIYRDIPVQKTHPITEIIGKNNSVKKILWFGGIYPWFDLRELVDAVDVVNKKTPAKLVIVGAKNPYNHHPDFIQKYQQLTDYIKEKSLSGLVILQDWVSFSDRADWYLDSDVVVVINKQGQENELAWRTRLVDFMWADLPIITNGGDPLGEIMIEAKAAVRITDTSADAIAAALDGLFAQPALNGVLKSNLKELRGDYYWDIVTKELQRRIISGYRAKDLSTIGLFDVSGGAIPYGRNLIMRVVRKASKIPAYAKKHGYGVTARVIGSKVLGKVRRASGSKGLANGKPEFVVISHQLDMSGAPFVAMEMAIEYQSSPHNLPLRFISYLPVHKENIRELNRHGVRPTIIMNRDEPPMIYKGSTVLLNTVAHSEAVKDDLFRKLESRYIKKIIWYSHEDHPQYLFRDDEKKRIRRLMDDGRLVFFTAAKRTQENYQAFFAMQKGVKRVIYRHVVEPKYHRVLGEKEFSTKLSFSLPGTVGDGRKGQLPVLYAFIEFYHNIYKKNPQKYRDFELVFVGISTDFLSQQIKLHAGALGGRLVEHGMVTHEECMDIVYKSNITICYSLRECLPLYVYEGMVTGHPILRNDSSGMEEQLVEGKNGFRLETADYRQLIDTIETILNKKKTTDKALAKMSGVSNQIALKCENNTYIDALREEMEDE